MEDRMTKKIVLSFLFALFVSAALCIAWIAGACYNFTLPIGLPFAAWLFYVYDTVKEHRRGHNLDDFAQHSRR